MLVRGSTAFSLYKIQQDLIVHSSTLLCTGTKNKHYSHYVCIHTERATVSITSQLAEMKKEAKVKGKSDCEMLMNQKIINQLCMAKTSYRK